MAFKLGPKSRPGELLAALGEKLATYQDRDYLYIPQKKKLVQHRTATRDYCCDCGSRLVTKHVGGEWRTVCAADSAHSQMRFMRQVSYQARQSKQRLAQAEGGE